MIHTKLAMALHRSMVWLTHLEVTHCTSDTTYCTCERCIAVGELFRAWRSEIGPVDFPPRKENDPAGSVR